MLRWLLDLFRRTPPPSTLVTSHRLATCGFEESSLTLGPVRLTGVVCRWAQAPDGTVRCPKFYAATVAGPHKDVATLLAGGYCRVTFKAATRTVTFDGFAAADTDMAARAAALTRGGRPPDETTVPGFRATFAGVEMSPLEDVYVCGYPGPQPRPPSG